MMQTAVKTKKPRKQAVSGCFWAMRTYRGRIKDDHKIGSALGEGIDWMIRRSCSVSATSVMRFLPSEAFIFNCTIFSYS